MSSHSFLELPDDSIAEIASVFDQRIQEHAKGSSENEQFLKACRLVAMSQGVDLSEVDAPSNKLSTDDLLEYLANASNLRFRPVVLNSGWWRNDHGPLLVFEKEDNRPAAIVPDRRGRYQLVQFRSGGEDQVTRLSAKAAARLDTGACTFYRPFPVKRIAWRDLLGFGFRGLGQDVRRLLYSMAAANMLGLAVPVSIGFIFDDIIPNSNFSLLGQFVLGLAFVSICASLFFVAGRIATTRLELKMTSSLQPAVWDRLLRLPVSFFRKFSVGDLSDRAAGVDEIQRIVSANALGIVLGGAFSVFSLALMFYYSFPLALGAVALTLVYVAINVIATIRQLKFQRSMLEVQGKNYGFLLQMLNGLTKLRVAGKMENAFNIWLGKLTRTKKLYMRAELARIQLSAVSSMYSVLLIAILFGMVATTGSELSLGEFMAFNAAYGYFFASVLAMSGVVASSLEIVPTYERSACILNTLPEETSAGMPIGDLKGEIRLDTVCFAYPTELVHRQEPNPEPVIDALDMCISAGELVGLVGPSGGGKSTLFRLLLGFERPSHGQILFDGRNLADLNLNSLRKRIGVVLQHSQLLPGTLLENILSGDPSSSEDDAWAAAERACIDKEIEAMPMGMHTFVSEGGKNFSVGQRQRILIARAFAKKPAVLLFDEATSAIDNNVQTQLVENILAFGATCILSSHRLTTVRAAAKLFVLDKGRIVQQGTYPELITESGLFSGLAKRPA